MAAYVEALAGHLDPALFSPAVVARLGALARGLPPLSSGGFECRLAAGAEAVDLQLFLPRVRLPLTPALQAQPAWRALGALCETWTEGAGAEGALLGEGLRDVWVELDLQAAGEAPGPPGLFFHLAAGAPAGVLPALAARFLPEAHALAVARAAKRALASLPPGAELSHLGVMLGRPGAPTCLRVCNLGRDDVGPVLARLGDPAAAEGALGALASGCESFALLLDDEGGSRLGLEGFLAPAAAPAAWSPVLARLAGAGLASAGKSAALLRWPGVQGPPPDGPWPAHLALGERLLGPHAASVLQRRISHLKLVLEGGRVTAAKAYLAFDHRWLPRPPDGEPPPAR
jgi:hypothetical protein